MICIKNLDFQQITESAFKQINLSDVLFFVLSQSGGIDAVGNIYFFTTNGAFFMDKNKYGTKFIDFLFSIKWRRINLYFCDFLIINPKIYDLFVCNLTEKNIRDFWFESAIEIYKERYCE